MSTQRYTGHSPTRVSPEILLQQAKEDSEQTSIVLGEVGTNDCVVHSETQTFHAQRERLAAASSYFHKQLIDSRQPPRVMYLHGVAALPVRILLLWIYHRIDVTNLPLLRLMTNQQEYVDEAVIDILMQTATIAHEWKMCTLVDHALFATERALHVLNPDTATGDFIETVVEKAFSENDSDVPFDRLRNCLLDALHGSWQRSRFVRSPFLRRTIDETPRLAAALALRAFPQPKVSRFVVASCTNPDCPSDGWDWAFGVESPRVLEISHAHCVFCGARGVSLALREFARRWCGPFTLVSQLNEGRVRGTGVECSCPSGAFLLVSKPPGEGNERLFCVHCGNR